MGMVPGPAKASSNLLFHVYTLYPWTNIGTDRHNMNHLGVSLCFVSPVALMFVTGIKTAAVLMILPLQGYIKFWLVDGIA